MQDTTRSATEHDTPREWAEGMAHDIALLPGIYRHWIGDDDQIIGRDGELTGYRVTDFLSEAELLTYRAFVG